MKFLCPQSDQNTSIDNRCISTLLADETAVRLITRLSSSSRGPGWEQPRNKWTARRQPRRAEEHFARQVVRASREAAHLFLKEAQMIEAILKLNVHWRSLRIAQKEHKIH